MSDMYTLEERELMREQARRLKLRTDLQEARIAERKAIAQGWRAIGVWSCEHLWFPEGADERTPVVTLFYMEERYDGKQRRITPGPMSNKKTGVVILNQMVWAEFFKTRLAYTDYILQWLHFNMTHDDLRAPLAAHEGIKITIPRRRK